MSESLFTLLGVAQWFCLVHHSPFLPKSRVCLGLCPIGGVCRFRGWRWLRDRGALLRTAVDYARVFPFFVTEDDCTLDANVLPVLLFTFYDDSSSSIRISPFLAERDRTPRPKGRATHLTSWYPGVATSRSACSGHSHDAT